MSATPSHKAPGRRERDSQLRADQFARDARSCLYEARTGRGLHRWWLGFISLIAALVAIEARLDELLYRLERR